MLVGEWLGFMISAIVMTFQVPGSLGAKAQESSGLCVS